MEIIKFYLQQRKKNKDYFDDITENYDSLVRTLRYKPKLNELTNIMREFYDFSMTRERERNNRE